MPAYCPNCGNKLPEGSLYCEECGTRFEAAEVLNEHIFKNNSDKYRWVYEQPMLKSFFLLFEVWKVIALSALIIVLLMSCINLISGEGIEGVLFALKMGALVFGIIFVLSLPAYYIVTKANNGMYTVLFEMDDEGIDHIQIKTEKAQALEALVVLAGGASKNRTLTGSGLLSAAGGSLYSDFAKVRKIRADRRNNLIKLNGRFVNNQVYVEDEDFDFVFSFIKEHCPDAVIK